MPMMDPWKAYATLLDWVYFKASVATTRFVTALDGSSLFLLTMFEKTEGWILQSFLFCWRWIPYTCFVSILGGT